MADTDQASIPGSSPQVTPNAIAEIAQVIVQKIQPDKVVLFGSYAYGEPKPWSDVDFLVVMDTPQKVTLGMADEAPGAAGHVREFTRNRLGLGRQCARRRRLAARKRVIIPPC